ADRINVHRSRVWVDALARQFRQTIAEPDVCVFSKYDKTNRERFGLNEMLYDVCVCRAGSVTSPVHGNTLHYICKPLWQVESEFAHDTRQTMFDFNKLVLGSAENKLCVCPATPRPENYLNTLADPAGCCSGTVYVGFVPNPSTWAGGSVDLRCYQF